MHHSPTHGCEGKGHRRWKVEGGRVNLPYFTGILLAFTFLMLFNDSKGVK